MVISSIFEIITARFLIVSVLTGMASPLLVAEGAIVEMIEVLQNDWMVAVWDADASAVWLP